MIRRELMNRITVMEERSKKTRERSRIISLGTEKRKAKIINVGRQ